MEARPDELEDYGDVMSNFDHTIRVDAERYLKTHKAYGNYAGWNFYGEVWFDEKFKCQVDQYCRHSATIYGDSLAQIMEKVSSQFGTD